MAFVNEAVSEADKRNVLFTRTDPFPPNRNKLLRPFEWTIDRQEDFILMAVGVGNPEMWDRFIFQWKGEMGYVMADPKAVKIPFPDSTDNFLLEVTWTVKGLKVPSCFSGQAEEVKHLLVEAFRTYGRWGGIGRIKSVEVVWDCSAVVGGGSVAY